MHYERIEPEKNLNRFIECYWLIQEDDPTQRTQKIIPDGFPELIFHFGDPYLVNLNSSWKLQSKTLLAGQITKHFYLQNTGISDIIGIKLNPTALTHLFDIPMPGLTDQVVDISMLPDMGLRALDAGLRSDINRETRMKRLNEYFSALAEHSVVKNNPVDRAIELIFIKNGMITVNEILSAINLSERQFERLFKKHVGLSPKFYARIIRFNYIFQLKEQKGEFWKDLALDAAFYDQSHFIRDFKAFTGESPSAYFFDEPNMANFFLKMKKKIK
ncbi:MAG TPA: helix-turn-helix domain-containing protein [Chitinophagaceae bacterium]|nr:helix-turn-helix domain-containing protein [Chitinophagaceae bacterium]